jgi:hypothetical protein
LNGTGEVSEFNESMPANCTRCENANGETQTPRFIGSNFFSTAGFIASFGASHICRICMIISGFGLRQG